MWEARRKSWCVYEPEEEEEEEGEGREEGEEKVKRREVEGEDISSCHVPFYLSYSRYAGCVRI